MNETVKQEQAVWGWRVGVIGATAAVATGLLVGQLNILGFSLLLLLVAGVIIALVYARMNIWRGLILLLVATQFSIFTFNVGGYNLRPDQLTLLFVLFVFLILFLTRKVRLHSTIIDIPIVGLITVGFISSYLYSSDPAFSFRSLVLQMVYMTMYFLTVNVLLEHRSKINTIVKIMMVIAILHALYAIASLAAYMAGFNIGGISYSHLSTMSIPSTAGFFPEANLLGAFATIMLALFFTHLVTQKGSGILKNRYLVLGVVLLFGISLTSLTRSAWIGLLAIIVVLPFYAKPKFNVVNPRALLVITVIVLGITLIVFPVVNYVFSAASGTSNALLNRFDNILNFNSTSFEGRTAIQQVAIDQWRLKPVLGYGVLSLPVGEHSNRGWLFSTMIQSLHDTGLVGAFFMLWIHIVPIGYGLWASTKARDQIRRATLVGLSLGALALFISSQLSSFIWLGFPWVFLGILVAAAKDTIDSSREAETSGFGKEDAPVIPEVI
ncbi:MAG: O-antigen ligase family protein [Thermoleophilia bacterium]